VATGLFNAPARPIWATAEALAASGFQGQVVDAQTSLMLKQPG